MQKPRLLSGITKTYLLFGLVVLTVTLWAARVNQKQLFQPTDMVAIGQAYSRSQYILGDASTEWIDDSLTYAYAGVAYIQGEDPTITNFAHPPLVKYVFGLSYLIFGSVYTLNLGILIAVIISFLVLAKKIGLSPIFSIVALLLFVASSPIIPHVGQTLLDSWLTLFALLFFIVLFSSNLSATKTILSFGIIIGVIASSKFFFPFTFLYVGTLGIWLLYKKQLKQILFILPLAGIVYLLTYSVYFINNHTLLDFMKFEVFRLNWWSAGSPLGVPHIIHTFIYGCVLNWWSKVNPTLCTPDADWRWWLPILAVVQFFAQGIVIYLKNSRLMIMSIFTSTLLILLLMASFSQLRYFYPIIPFWILLCLAALQQVIKRQRSSIKN